MLVDPIMCGAAYVLGNVFLWPEHASKGRVNVKEGNIFVNGNFDYAACRAKKTKFNRML